MTRTLLSVGSALLLTLTGCSRSEPAEEATSERTSVAGVSTKQGGLAPASEPPSAAPADVQTVDAASSPRPDRLPSEEVPERYRGRWDASEAACRRTASEMRLVIGARSLRFYESEGEVLAVRGADGDAVSVELRLTGEGETRTEKRFLRVTPERQLVVETNGQPAIRVRCPDA